jgi:hypothetical protein
MRPLHARRARFYGWRAQGIHCQALAELLQRPGPAQPQELSLANLSGSGLLRAVARVSSREKRRRMHSHWRETGVRCVLALR